MILLSCSRFNRSFDSLIISIEVKVVGLRRFEEDVILMPMLLKKKRKRDVTSTLARKDVIHVRESNK